MPSLKERQVRRLSGSLESHPAFEAWRRLTGHERLPTAMDAFQTDGAVEKGNKPLVYRMYGVWGVRPVIAKLAPRTTIDGESVIYREALARLPIPAVRWLGSVDEGPRNGRVWSFLEDAGDNHWLIENPDHRVLAAEWLAQLHTLGASLTCLSDLPDTGERHYLAHLMEAHDRLRGILLRPDLPSDDHLAVLHILAAFDRIRDHWPDCVHMTESIATLVHGDFKRKNVRVRGVHGEAQLLAIDWEFAGRGSPAADVAECGLENDAAAARAYRNSASALGWALSEAGLQRMICVGAIFRLASSVLWESMSLGDAYRPRFGWRIREYRDRLNLRTRQLGLGT